MSDQIRLLLSTIESGQPADIWEASKELSRLATDVALFLMDLLHRSDRAETRAAAAYALGASRFASARTSLEAALDDRDEDASVRGHAAEALAYIGSRESMSVLIAHLKDADPPLQYWCAFALGQLGDANAVPHLESFAESAEGRTYQNHSLRGEALDAIAAINKRLDSISSRGE